jgi:peptidoglycan/LPS O-acetylase OafA/YrhL
LRIYIAVGLMLVFYLFPWVTNPSAALSLNGYDLAEWTSLHPAVRDAAIPLLTTALLRLPLACFALLVAFGARRTWVSALGVLLISVSVLRPEFFTALGDPNYRQQAALAAFALVGGALGLSGRMDRWRRWVLAATGVIGALACVIGLAQAYDLMRGFSLPTGIGFGGVALAIGFAGVAAAAAANQTGQR